MRKQPRACGGWGVPCGAASLSFCILARSCRAVCGSWRRYHRPSKLRTKVDRTASAVRNVSAVRAAGLAACPVRQSPRASLPPSAVTPPRASVDVSTVTLPLSPVPVFPLNARRCVMDAVIAIASSHLPGRVTVFKATRVDGDQEVARLARAHGATAVLTSDSDLLMFDIGAGVMPFEDMDISAAGVRGVMITPSIVGKILGVPVPHLPTLACVVGNDSTQPPEWVLPAACTLVNTLLKQSHRVPRDK